jgi:hypothetical protein
VLTAPPSPAGNPKVLRTLENLPSPDTLFHVNKYVKDRKLSLVPTSIFEHQLANTLFKAVRPPGRKHLGTNLRKIDPVPTLPKVVQEMLSTARGLPAVSPAQDLARVPNPGYPQQLEGMPIKALKVTATLKRTKVKLMRQDNISSACSFEEHDDRLGFGPLRLQIRKVAPKTYTIRKISMAASPFNVDLREPQGKAARQRFATVGFKFNVLTMDPETMEVHFGVTNYEPWTKKWLRWEMCDLLESMAVQPNLKVPFTLEFLNAVGQMKNDKKLARKPDWSALQ